MPPLIEKDNFSTFDNHLVTTPFIFPQFFLWEFLTWLKNVAWKKRWKMNMETSERLNELKKSVLLNVTFSSMVWETERGEPVWIPSYVFMSLRMWLRKWKQCCFHLFPVNEFNILMSCLSKVFFIYGPLDLEVLRVSEITYYFFMMRYLKPLNKILNVLFSDPCF